jgi:nicotinate-nucleotide--dimethylbenzimidazole phosphoribosyltransferase
MAMTPAPKSLSEVHDLIAKFPGLDADAAMAAEMREPSLTKPPGSLGRLEEVAHWLASWQGRHPAKVEAPQVIVFAANHGVSAQGVSAYPPEVTAQMVSNFEHGGAAINQISHAADATMKVVDVGVTEGTQDFSTGPAMTEESFCNAFGQGMAAVNVSTDLLAVGEMGIGNTTTAAALSHALHGGTAETWTGAGTGVEGAALANKVRVVGESVALHKAETNDPLDLFRRLGGLELVAIAGAITRARLERIPVLLDGYVCTAAAAPLAAAAANALDHCLAGHVSAEPGHTHLLEKLGKVPLLDLNMRLGEASGAAVAIALVKMATAYHSGMATFDEAGVTDKNESP